MPVQKLRPEIINAAILGFEEQKKQIDVQIAELRQMLGGGPAISADKTETAPPKRKISAAARRRMSLGQQKRWEAIKGKSEPPAPVTPEPEKPKRKISEEGMKRIIAATKKRWALKRAEAAKAKPAVAKKAAAKKAPAKKAPAKKAAKAAGPTAQ